MQTNSSLKLLLFGFGISLLVAACGGSKKLVFDNEGSVVNLDEGSFYRSLTQSFEEAEAFEFRGKAKYVSPSQDVSFRYTIRIIRDSVIWVDITDPYLGLKVARALILPDSAVFYNRFESTWMAGGIGLIQERIQLGLSFHHLQSLLLGEPLYLPSSSDDLTVKPADAGAEVLAKGAENDALFLFDTAQYHYVYHLIPELPLFSQRIEDGPRLVRIDYTYQNDDPGIPETIAVFMNWESEVLAELKHSEVSRHAQLNVPFSIPNDYERVQ